MSWDRPFHLHSICPQNRHPHKFRYPSSIQELAVYLCPWMNTDIVQDISRLNIVSAWEKNNILRIYALYMKYRVGYLFLGSLIYQLQIYNKTICCAGYHHHDESK